MPDAPAPPEIAQEYELVPVADLVLHPDNPNRGDLPAIVESMRANGWWGAAIVQRSTRRVLAGNHRVQAAKQFGIETVPVLWLDVDDEHALRVLLADNETARRGEWERPALAGLLTDIEERRGDLLGTGFARTDLDKLLAELDAEANVVLGEPAPAKPASVRDGFEGRCPRCGFPDAPDSPA